MFKPINFKINIFLLLCLITQTTFWGQDVQINLPQQINICAPFKIDIILTNSSSTIIQEATLDIDLPCGLEYVKSSATNLIEKDVAKSNPISFNTAELKNGETIETSIYVVPSCETKLCIDNASSFRLFVNWSNSEFNSAYESPLFNINTAHLLFSFIENESITLLNSASFERKIRIKNTRLGTVTSFTLEDRFNHDSYQSSIVGSASVDIFPLARVFYFDEEIITKFGDGDEFFEYNEEIELTQQIYFSDCPSNINTASSTLSLSWGCNDTPCQTDQRNTNISLVQSFSIGDILRVDQRPQEPTCYFNEHTNQEVLLINTSTFATSRNLLITIASTNDYLGIVDQSISPHINLDSYSTHYWDRDSTQCGVFYEKGRVKIDSIAPGDTVALSWTNLYCDSIQCNKIGSSWSINYSYEKDCAEVDDQFQSNIIFHNFETTLDPVQTVITSSQGALNDKDTLLITLHSSSSSLSEIDGVLCTQFTLPCGMSPIDTPSTNTGLIYDSITTQVNDTFQILNVYYTLPVNTDSLTQELRTVFNCNDICNDIPCDSEFAGTCPQGCENNNPKIGIVGQSIVIPSSECIPPPSSKSVDVKPLIYQCDTTTCLDSLPGWVNYSVNVLRHSIGKEDINNDGIPDSDNLAHINDISHHRIMIGDTFEIKLNGKINIDFNNDRSQRLFLTLSLSPGQLTPSIPETTNFEEFDALLQNDGIKVINLSGQIIKNNGSVYNLPQLKLHSNTSPAKLLIDLNVDSLINNQLLPKAFQYNDGDSIKLSIFKRIDYNIKSSDKIDIEPSILNLKYDSYFGFDESLSGALESTKCNCKNLSMELASVQFSKYKFQYFSPKNPLTCIDDRSSFNTFPTAIGVRKGFFPNEFRPIFTPKRFTHLKGLPIEIESVQFRVFNAFNQNVLNQQIDSWQEDQNTFSYEFPKLEIDEYLKINWKFNTIVKQDFICDITSSNEKIFISGDLDLESDINYNSGINSNITLPLSIGSQFSPPRIELTTDQPFVQSFTDSIIWNLTLHNPNIRDTISNGYIRLKQNPSIEVLEVIINHTSIQPTSNGFINLPMLLPSDSLNFSIIALSSSCLQQVLQLEYGWFCHESSDLKTPCISNDFSLIGISPPAEAELLLNQPLVIPLCSVSDTFIIELINAGLGSLHNPILRSRLPDGLYIAQAFIRNPQNQMLTSLPFVQNDNEVIWDLTGSGIDRINGIDKLDIVYTVETDCDFISGSVIIHEFNGKNNCNGLTNKIAQVSKPIKITDITSELDASIQTFSLIKDCGKILEFEFKILKSNSFEASDLHITIPEGFSVINIPDIWSANLDNQILKFQLPSEKVDTTIQIVCTLDSIDICNQHHILSQITTTKNALCLDKNEECEIQLIEVQDIYSFDLNPFQLHEASFKHAYAEQDYHQLEINLSTSNSIGQYLHYEIYLDTNNSKSRDSFDQSIVFDSIIISDSIFSISVSNIGITYENLCQLRVKIGNEKDCICQYLDEPLKEIQIQLPYIQSCLYDQVTLGIQPIGITSSTWTPSHELSCDDCFTPNWTPKQAGVYSFQQSVQDSLGCQMDFQHHIQISQPPTFNDTAQFVCYEDEIRLISNADTVKWYVRDSLISSNSILELRPTTASEYLLVQTNQFGCTSTDTIDIIVIPKPPKLYNDTSFCYGEMKDIIPINNAENCSVVWVNGTGYLDQIDVIQPSILQQKTHTYFARITKSGCSSTDTILISFFDKIDFSFPEDQMIQCEDDEVLITLDTSFTYEWFPFHSIECINEDCSTVYIDEILENNHFNLTVIDDEGCTDSIQVSFIPIGNDSLVFSNHIICPSDSILINGQYHKGGTTFCDTTGMDCKIIRCHTIENSSDSSIIHAFYENIETGQILVLDQFSTFQDYEWEDSTTLSCVTCNTPELEVQQNQNFKTTAIDSNGCVVTIIHHINIQSLCNQIRNQIPNSFTPNDDGENDVFRILGNVDNVQRMQIFNEWGMEVFNSKTKFEWDGTFKGESVSPSTYIYLITINCNRTKEFIHGEISLIR